MKLSISTKVEQDYRTVHSGFNLDLFRRLNPTFPSVKVLRFDGSTIGDEVHLELNFVLWKEMWISRITADQQDEREIFFIDEGVELPFFLSRWRHKHRIIRAGEGAIIADEIEYECPLPLMSILMYPMLFLQFIYRKPAYRRHFGR